VLCQKVPVTGVVGAVATLTGCVVCQNVPVTALDAGACSFAEISLSIAITVAAVASVAVLAASVVDPRGMMSALAALIGCFDCQKVPVTGVDGIDAMLTG
jgi:hypothetical protein